MSFIFSYNNCLDAACQYFCVQLLDIFDKYIRFHLLFTIHYSLDIMMGTSLQWFVVHLLQTEAANQKINLSKRRGLNAFFHPIYINLYIIHAAQSPIFHKEETTTTTVALKLIMSVLLLNNSFYTNIVVFPYPQLRYLQTLNAISAEKNSTIIFPLPIDLVKHFINTSN